jgi:hypothetical protein|tara:strand:- start:1908 stop:2324 length:417 start_codon:yes stop_codon:yes gene_type:complete
MNKYLPQKSSERDLTERQQKFLDCLIQTGGDLKLAADLAGYAEGSYLQVIKSLKNEIIDLATQILAQSAPRAAFKLVHVMESDEPIPQANVKLQAAQTILDRIGVSKTDKLDISVDDSSGSLFILPAKRVIDIEVAEN